MVDEKVCSLRGEATPVGAGGVWGECDDDVPFKPEAGTGLCVSSDVGIASGSLQALRKVSLCKVWLHLRRQRGSGPCPPPPPHTQLTVVL